MEELEKQKEQLLKDLWYKRNQCHDNDQEGNDRFWVQYYARLMITKKH